VVPVAEVALAARAVHKPETVAPAAQAEPEESVAAQVPERLALRV
jgi:hypothetical protein